MWRYWLAWRNSKNDRVCFRCWISLTRKWFSSKSSHFWQKIIHWADSARKNSEKRQTGDGFFNGLLLRHDEKCHLNEHGVERDGDKYDYPSMAQTASILNQENIMVAFRIVSQRWTRWYTTSHAKGLRLNALSGNIKSDFVDSENMCTTIET